uniref:PH domain-containing protein n=1 Tax=Anopheles maculatus TaxID=74869 RepID=A0A182TCF0_9DIPT
MMQLQRDLVTDCVQFLKTITSYLYGSEEVCCQEGGLERPPSSEQEEDQTYLNVFHDNRPVGVRDRLIVQCEALLERFEKSASVTSLMNENDAKEIEGTREVLEDEEENSYLDMSGSNTLKPNTSSSNVSIIETKEELSAQHDESFDEEMLFDAPQENSYDFTTDQILYDECLQEVSYEQDQPSSTITPRTPTPENTLHESQCPFGGLPASHLRLQQSPKHGTLFKQEKRLFFDQFKKYYVGLIGKWLLVYNSHNDLKPWQTIFIKSIKLDLNLNEQINEKHLFQIITHTDSKVHFLSPSFQDLNEWIVAIENNLIEKVERPV